MKSLFAKIFVWFFVTSIALTVASYFFAIFVTGTPLLRHWVANYADLYARSAVQAYELDGTHGLERYLANEQPLHDVKTTVIGPDGSIVRGDEPTFAQKQLLTEANSSGETECRLRLGWQCAMVVKTPRGNFSVLASVAHARRTMRGMPLSAVLLRALLMAGVAGLLCFALARYIARPVEVLQGAARRAAQGDLSVRVAPQLAPRKDELVSLAEEFDQMAERIETLLQSQRQMLGDISHELRSPLTRLGVALELAQDGDAEALQRMSAELRKLDGLIEQILMLNRLDAGEKWAELQPTNLETVLNEIVRDANYEGRVRNVSVDLHTSAVTLDGNPALLKSCIENVVRNALRYSPENSRVEVIVELICDREVSITVRDRGPGVPAEALRRLFDPFYRVAESRSEGSGGRGLGLSISQRAAAMHGGTIVAKNREGGGLEIEIRVPLKKRDSFVSA